MPGDTTNAFLYCLAVAAKRTQVIFFLAMSNHYHAGVIDTAGRLPEFLEYFPQAVRRTSERTPRPLGEFLGHRADLRGRAR
jgi:hypothetical protein